MKESNGAKITGEVMAISGTSLVVRTIGLDTKNVPWPDDHQVKASRALLADVKKGDWVKIIGRIADDNRTQYVEAGVLARIETPAEPMAAYVNLAKAEGVTDREIQYLEKKIVEGKIVQAMANLSLKTLGVKIFGTVWGDLANKFNAGCPVGSEVQLYGRMRRKEITGADGDTRRWIDIASDNFHFPGLTKIVKKGAGAKDEFADMESNVLAFTTGEKKKLG